MFIFTTNNNIKHKIMKKTVILTMLVLAISSISYGQKKSVQIDKRTSAIKLYDATQSKYVYPFEIEAKHGTQAKDSLIKATINNGELKQSIYNDEGEKLFFDPTSFSYKNMDYLKEVYGEVKADSMTRNSVNNKEREKEKDPLLKPKFGITAGLNLAGAFPANLNPSIGFNIGIALKVPIATPNKDMFAFEPGLIYSRRGLNISKDQNVSLSYIHMPLNFSYTIHLNDKFAIEPFGGIYIGALASSEENEDSVFDKDSLQTLSAGYDLGFAFVFKSIKVGVRYEKDFTNLTNEDVGNIRGNNTSIFATLLF